MKGITVKDAAMYLNIDVQMVRYYVRTKRIKATKPAGRDIMIDKRSVEKFKVENNIG